MPRTDSDRNKKIERKDCGKKIKRSKKDELSSYCSSITASSEESPTRADYRVKRAAELVAKNYLEDISNHVKKVNRTTKTFEPSVLKNAHQEINGRQCARLEYIKA